MEQFRAFKVYDTGGVIAGRIERLRLEDLDPGEVVVRAEWSDVNYKDALAATGKGKIMRRFPMVGGIDVAGQVQSSSDARFREGDPVLVTGFGLSEEHDGGYSEYVRVPADWLIALPEGLSLRETMALGTAGFTAGIAVDRMQINGQEPALGPVLVNGATGGVGSLAIQMLAGLGFSVSALTAKAEAADYLRSLGASEIVLRDELRMGQRPLEKALWGGAVDNVGAGDLAWLTRTVRPMGNIASIGLAGGSEFATTVMPFILRGINLLGINSVMIPRSVRERVWRRLGTDLKPARLAETVSREVGLEELPGVFDDFIAGRVVGRTLVRIGS